MMKKTSESSNLNDRTSQKVRKHFIRAAPDFFCKNNTIIDTNFLTVYSSELTESWLAPGGKFYKNKSASKSARM